MEIFPDAVSCELGRNHVFLAQKDLIYRVSNTLERYSGATNRNGAFEGLVCYFYQVSTRIVLNNIYEQVKRVTGVEMLTTSPTKKVWDVSPWYPFKYTVMSMLTMSPSSRGRLQAEPVKTLATKKNGHYALVRNPMGNDVVDARRN